MKNIVVFLVIIFVGFISCRNSDENIQNIDQIVRLYIDSVGRDMLNSSDTLAYQSLSFNDVYGDTENSPVSFSSAYDNDTIHYRQYIAGATRYLVDDTDKNNLIYESKIALTLATKYNNKTINTYDTLTLRYIYTPILFQINQAFYNKQEITMKKSDDAHLIKIYK